MSILFTALMHILTFGKDFFVLKDSNESIFMLQKTKNFFDVVIGDGKGRVKNFHESYQRGRLTEFVKKLFDESLHI